MKNLGSYHDKNNNIIYAFISNGTNSYLCKTNATTINWEYVEGTPTAFEIDNKAYFVQKDNDILFVKGETQTISSVDGGVFYIDGSAIKLYGKDNNPTPKYITYSKERLWTGNITEIGGVSQASGGKAWNMVSKVFPEADDTTVDNTDFATLTVTKGVRTKIEDTNGTPTVDLSGFNVGDNVYISGTDTDLGEEVLNNRYYEITEKTATYIIIDADTDSQTGTVSTINVSLRGNTWCPSNVVYEDILDGAGIFKCDSNESDEVMQIVDMLGFVAIFRRRSIYFFTGALETANFSLAKKLNVTYGAVSSDVAITSGGIWFVSQYGLSKIEGVTVKTTRTELDNIVELTPTEIILPDFNNIANKNKLIVHSLGRKIWLHSADEHLTYALDTYANDWTQYDGILAEDIIDINNETYALYKHLVFKLDTEYQLFDMVTYTAKDMASRYKTGIIDFNNSIDYKELLHLRTLLQGIATSANDVIVTFNLYYNGSSTIGRSVAFDVRTGGLETWYNISTSETDTWNDISSNETLTWSDILGDNVTMMNRDSYDLGTVTDLQLEFTHTGSEDFKVSNIVIEFDLNRR